MTEPIFLVGAPRSGTTLLAEMLNRHDEVFIFNETVFYDALTTINNGNKSCGEEKLNNLARHLISRIDARKSRDGGTSNQFGSRFSSNESELIKSEFKKFTASSQLTNLPSAKLLENFLTIVATTKGKSRWGEKTPNHAFHLSEILEDFPSARIINVVRDPWDFLLSYKFAWRQVGGVKENEKLYHPIITSMLWRRSLTAYYATCKLSRHTDQCMSVRYEDLINSPKEIMEDVCNFINITPLTDTSLRNESNTSFQNRKENLSAIEIGACNAICGKLANELGYKNRSGTPYFIALTISIFSIPRFIARSLPILRQRFGNSIFRYLKARKIL